MNRQKLILIISVLALVAGTALLLSTVRQKLGPPGVKAAPIPGSARWEVYLPEHVLDFASTNRPIEAGVLTMLPQDTSLAERLYYKPGAIPVVSSVVLMGTDRTSIHKAEYCLKGQGLRIDQATEETIHLDQPQSYDLPIIKLMATDSLSLNGQMITKRCVYVYWYVTDGALSNDRSGFGRMWAMSKQLVLTGVLQRWAYVRFYAFCDPGQEDATFAQIKQMIAASVPQFQLMPRSANAVTAQR